MANRTLNRDRVHEGEPESIGVTFTGENTNGDSFNVFCGLWRCYMPGETANQSEFDKAKKSALESVASLPTGIRFSAVRGISDIVGDAGNTTEETDVGKVIREKFDRLADGTLVSRSGGVDPVTEMYRTIIVAHAKEKLGLGKTKALDRAKDDKAKLESDLAKKFGMPVAEYRDKVTAKAQESLSGF